MKKTLIILILLSISYAIYARQIKQKIACVGNSVTYGYLMPDREKNAYPYQLQQMLGDKYEVGNFGKSGATLLTKGHRPYIEQQEYKDALSFSADYVIIHLGLNDTDPRNWPNYKDDFFKDYLNLINSFRAVNPQTKIWICRMTPITDKHPRFRSGTRDWYGQIQNEIEKIADYANVGLIDLEKSLYNRPDLLPDALHPNVEGATILTKTVFSALTGDYGGLHMSAIYSDNMVLQRDKNLNISGIANTGDEVTIEIASQVVKTHTGTNGKWTAKLNPMQASNKSHIMTIATASCTLTYKNIAIGEVWLCSGQSNMAFKLKHAATAKQALLEANNLNIRFFNMQPRWETNATEWSVSVLDSLNHLQYYKNTNWQVCSATSASEFSAVAYYFGKMLTDSLGVPVGLINNTIGGTPIESWIDRCTLEYEYPDVLTNWLNNDIIQGWVRQRAALNIKQSTNKQQRHPYEPCYAFESGIIPLNKFTINGVVWYQGESNAHNVEIHEKLFLLLVNSWRKYWNNSDLPFYYAQLSSLNRPSWTWFRDSQRCLMYKIPNIYMAVSSDVGDSLDVHPTRKKEVGERLALWALNKSFSIQNIVPSGPLYKEVEFKNGAAYVSFDYADGMKSEDGGELRTFEVAEVDGLYYPAKAVVENERIKIWTDELKNPRFVRYGWQPFTRANLINNSGLPASIFKSK